MRLDAVCDQDGDRRVEAARQCAGARIASRAEELLADPALDAVALATPAGTHFALALSALHAGKHVFVEKPLATRIDDAERLVDEAARRRLVLMVDHTFLFTPAVRHLSGAVAAGELGELRYYDAVRLALGRFRSDVNVLWDLAVHDLAVLDGLTREAPLAVSAQAASHLSSEREDIAFVTVYYPGSLIAHLHVNWLSPVKVGRTLVGGSLRTALWDDLEPSEKLRIYDSGAAHDDDGLDGEHQRHVGYRIGDMRAPHLPIYEPLAEAIAELARAIETGAAPLSDGFTGLRVVRLLAAADASLASRGAPVELAVEDRPRDRPRLVRS
jgi:predicted dehydrogenase